MTNVEALKNLYTALGGNAADVADAVTNVDVLNAIAEFLGGEVDATTISEAIENISAVAPTGGGEYETMLAGVLDGNVVDLTVPDGTAYLRPSVLNNLTKLKTITFADGAGAIANNSVQNCKALETVIIGNGVTSINSLAFDGCTALKTVTIGNGVTSILPSAFNGCSQLTTITINKPENSISGAPWGATNATVVWTG